MTSRKEFFIKSVIKTNEFERYLLMSEPKPTSDIVLDCTSTNYVMTLPLSYFVSKKGGNNRHKGKADTMDYESFRIINAQHRGGHAHSLVLIKSRAIKTNPHNIAIFESNGRNKYCSVRIIDDHDDHDHHANAMKNVTKDYTTISPEYNINYGSGTHNPGYCGIYGIICVVAFRHYRSRTGTLWLNKWKKLLAHMSQRIDHNVGSMGVTLAARVQEIIATTLHHSSRECEIVAEIKACIAMTKQQTVSFS
jgi:hypothetical protein